MLIVENGTDVKIEENSNFWLYDTSRCDTSCVKHIAIKKKDIILSIVKSEVVNGEITYFVTFDNMHGWVSDSLIIYCLFGHDIYWEGYNPIFLERR